MYTELNVKGFSAYLLCSFANQNLFFLRKVLIYQCHINNDNRKYANIHQAPTTNLLVTLTASQSAHSYMTL